MLGHLNDNQFLFKPSDLALFSVYLRINQATVLSEIWQPLHPPTHSVARTKSGHGMTEAEKTNQPPKMMWVLIFGSSFADQRPHEQLVRSRWV